MKRPVPRDGGVTLRVINYTTYTQNFHVHMLTSFFPCLTELDYRVMMYWYWLADVIIAKV